MEPHTVLLVNVSTLLWSGNVVLGRLFHHQIGPFTLSCLRAMVATLFFSVLLAARGQSWRQSDVTAREWKLLAALGLLGATGFQVLQYSALHYTTAINVGLVNATAPVVTFLLAYLVLRQRFSGLQVLGALLSLAGVAVIVSGGSLKRLFGLELNPGDLLVLAAVTFWGLYSVVGKIVMNGRPTLWVTAVSTALAVPMLLVPLAIEVVVNPPAFSPELGLVILYVGIGPSCIAFLTWNEGVRRMGPNGAAAFINTLPLFTMVLAGLILGEVPGASSFVGALFVVTGCLMAALLAPRDPAPQFDRQSRVEKERHPQ